MNLKIVFKDKTEVIIEDFTKVIVPLLNAEFKTISAESFDTFSLAQAPVSYRFVGKNMITALSTNILYLDLKKLD